MTQPTMDEDIQTYKDSIYMVIGKKIQKVVNIRSTNDYNHYFYQMNHFIRRSVRKNSKSFYERVEHLQKLILMPKQMNYDLETMGEDGFLKKWKINKNDLVFSRKKWRERYYDKQ